MITGRRAYPRWLVRGLAVFAILMTVLAAVFSREHHAVENERNAALSRYVALKAQDLQSSDPALAMQLALVAYRLSQTTQARSVLLDATAGEMPTRLLGRPGQTELALGDDGHRVAIAYAGDDAVALYGLRYAQLTPLATLPGGSGGGTAHVDSVALSGDGRLLAIGDSAGQVTLWDIRSPTHPRRLAVLSAGAGAVHGLSFSPASLSLAAADADGTVQRWSLVDARHPALAAGLQAPSGTALDAVGYSHDGSTLAAVGARGTLLVWPAHGGTTPLFTGTSGSATLTAVSYSPDGHSLAVGGQDGVVALWDLSASGMPSTAGTSLTATGSIDSLAFSRDGRYLAAATFGKAASVWSTSDWQQLASLPHPAAVTGVAFTDGDRHLITTDAAGTAMIWQYPAPSTYTFGSPLTGLGYAATKPQLAVALQSGGTDVWDVVDEWRPAPAGAWYAAPLSAAPAKAYWLRTTTNSTATTTTATGTGTNSSSQTVINPHAGDSALRRTQSQTAVLDSALSANGQLFAAAGADHLVWLWDVSDPASPQLLAKLTGFTGAVTAVVFSGNSKTLFAGSTDHTVRLWSLAKPAAPTQLDSSPLIGPSTAITRLALSPDSAVLAVATVDGHVWLWSVSIPAKANLSASLTAARDSLTALSFSPSDNILVAGGTNRRLTFWHYRAFEAVNRICALAGTPITRTEWRLYVPGAAYKPPCAKWTPPVPATLSEPKP